MNPVADTPLKVIPVTSVSRVPVMTTCVPAVPEVGDNPVSTGWFCTLIVAEAVTVQPLASVAVT
jgi:hypothetical protein